MSEEKILNDDCKACSPEKSVPCLAIIRCCKDFASCSYNCESTRICIQNGQKICSILKELFMDIDTKCVCKNCSNSTC